MRNTPDKPQNQYENDKLNQSKSRRVMYLRFALVTLVIILAFVAMSSRDGRSSKALATDSTAGKSKTLSAQETPSYLDYVAWPPAFTIQFSSNYLTQRTGKPQRTITLTGNQLFYQSAESNGRSDAKFKSVFPKCINLPGVPLRFFQRPCEFYMGRDPQHKNAYAAYVYSTDLHESFLLALNLGPPAQNFVYRYHQLLPLPPLPEPEKKTPLPVRAPAGGEPVQWFLTSGQIGILSPANDQGYYAAMATAMSASDGNKYNPPFSFTGAAPGVHGRLVYGQLVYDPATFVINPNFAPDTFTPPSGYTPIKPVCNQLPKMNCAVCHLSDAPHTQIFYTQPKRPTNPCKSRKLEP
jgi:hypothetical protein